MTSQWVNPWTLEKRCSRCRRSLPCGGVQAESEAAERPRFLVFGLPQGGDAGLAGEAPGRVQRAAAGATVKAHVR